jgi:hypothetical protein
MNEYFYRNRSDNYHFEKLNNLFTANALAQIAAASSCCSDSENKRYSGKLEIAPRK